MHGTRRILYFNIYDGNQIKCFTNILNKYYGHGRRTVFIKNDVIMNVHQFHKTKNTFDLFTKLKSIIYTHVNVKYYTYLLYCI